MKMSVRDSRWASAPVREIPSTLHLADEIYDLLPTSSRVIDLGCGVGITCLELGSQAGVEFTGVDINEKAIELARALAGCYDFDPGSFRVADAGQTGLPGGQFDLAIVQAFLTILETAAERRRILQEAYRLLRPSGHVYVADFLQAWHMPNYRERYLLGIEQFGEEGTFEVRTEDGQFEYVAHHFSEKEVVNLLAEAEFRPLNFRHRRVRTRSGNVVPGFIAICQRS